jgi:signal transduction histidine kinase
VTLFRKLMISSILLVSFAVAISTVLAITGQARALNDELIGKGELIAEQIGLSTREAFGSLNWISVENATQSVASAEDVIFCKVVMPDGTVYLADDRAYYGEPIEPDILNAGSSLIEDYTDPRTGRQGKLIIEQIEIGQETWWVLLAMSSDSVNGATRSVLRSNLLLAIAIMIPAIGGALVLSKGVSDPIVELANAAKAFAAGRLDHPVAIRAKGEVGVLARSFNGMIQELRASQEQLEDYSKGLEIRVEERTAELARANEALQAEITERKRVEERLTTIHTLGQKLVLSRDMAEIARSVVEAAWQVLHFPVCSLWLVDEEREMLVCWAQTAGLEILEVPPLFLDSEQGVIASVVRSRETIYLPDVSQDSRYVEGGFQSRSELCIPLRVGGQVIGALNAESKELDGFSLADRQLLEALANSAAITIQNAQLFQESQRRAEEMAALRQVNLATLSTLERDQVFEIMLDQLGTVIDYDTAAIKVITPDGKDKMVAGRGPVIYDQAMWDGFDVKDSKLVQEMKETRQPAVVHDVHTDERYARVGDWQAFRSWAGAPLFVKDDLTGYLAVEKTSPGFYEKKTVQILDDFARAAAIALENARLYEEVQQELTERKRAEEQLQRYAAELERANEGVKRFAYIVSHDLRAPLANLRGFSEELHYALEVIGSVMDTALPHLDEKQRLAVTMALEEDVPEALGFIDSSVTRMDKFIAAVLKLSRLGRRELELEPIDMDALVQATLQTLGHQIEERQVKVSVGPLPEVVADQTSMEQIMGNILSNAVKYLTPDRPAEIEIGAERSDVETTFYIRDNGRGIAEEDMDKVFAPFRRAGKQDVPGEGMGLPYVQTLVRRHGGRIWCESELGVGTTFSFSLSNHLAGGDL